MDPSYHNDPLKIVIAECHPRRRPVAFRDGSFIWGMGCQGNRRAGGGVDGAAGKTVRNGEEGAGRGYSKKKRGQWKLPPRHNFCFVTIQN
jgi:hypothetical protein